MTNLLKDGTPDSIYWKYIWEIIQVARNPTPIVFSSIIEHLKKNPQESILDISCCILSSSNAKYANGNPLTIQVIATENENNKEI